MRYEEIVVKEHKENDPMGTGCYRQGTHMFNLAYCMGVPCYRQYSKNAQVGVLLKPISDIDNNYRKEGDTLRNVFLNQCSLRHNLKN